MRPLEGYEQATELTQSERLPVGGYIIRVVQVKEEVTSSARYLSIAYDIAEGEHAGFYRKQFNGNMAKDKRWKGVYRLYLPQGQDKDRDDLNLRRFKTAIKCFERSNPGFVWENCKWNERYLVGKTVGAIMCDREYDIDGRRGYFTDCYRIVDESVIRSGEYTVPEPIRLKNTHNDYSRAASPSPFPPAPQDAAFSGPFPAAPQDDDFPPQWQMPAPQQQDLYSQQVDQDLEEDSDLPF